MSEQCYWAECRLPDEDQGLRMGVVLSESPNGTYPGTVPMACISTQCVAGGSHDLQPISRALFDEVMADDE